MRHKSPDYATLYWAIVVSFLVILVAIIYATGANGIFVQPEDATL